MCEYGRRYNVAAALVLLLILTVILFSMTPPTSQDTLAQLKDFANASPAVKLFAEWCEKCTEDAAWRGRFKVGHVHISYCVYACPVIVRV